MDGGQDCNRGSGDETMQQQKQQLQRQEGQADDEGTYSLRLLDGDQQKQEVDSGGDYDVVELDTKGDHAGGVGGEQEADGAKGLQAKHAGTCDGRRNSSAARRFGNEVDVGQVDEEEKEDEGEEEEQEEGEGEEEEGDDEEESPSVTDEENRRELESAIEPLQLLLVRHFFFC